MSKIIGVTVGTPYNPAKIGAGKSAYEIAVEQGFEGDEAAWLASLKGEQGERGASGVYTGDGEPPADCVVRINPKGIAGVYNPVPKTDDMTNPVGLGADGKLWTAPSDGGSVDLTGYATEKYVDDAIGGIDHPTPDLSGYVTDGELENALANLPTGGGGKTEELLVDFTTEEEVQVIDLPIKEHYDKINNARDIILELCIKKPVTDDGTDYGTVTGTFHAYWGKKIDLFSGKISPSNSISWGKDGLGLSVLSKSRNNYGFIQYAANLNYFNANINKMTGFSSSWENLIAKAQGDDILKISSELPMGVGTQIRLLVRGVIV